MTTEPFNIQEAFRNGFVKFKDNTFLLMSGMILIGFFFIMMILPSFIDSLLKLGLEENPLFICFECILSWICLIFILILFNGLYGIAIILSNNHTANYINYFQPIKLLLYFYVTGVLYRLIQIVIMMLIIFSVLNMNINHSELISLIICCVVGFYLEIQFSFSRYFVLDKGIGPIKALKASIKLTKGIKLKLLEFEIKKLFFILLSFLACYVGIMIAVPITIMATACLYRRLLETQDGAGIPPVLPVEPVSEPPVNPGNPQPPVES
jgi:hypothetical protein